jgi:YesN/AraC family two-component response regulator
MLRKNKIPYHLRPELVQYFNSSPLIPFYQCFEGILLTLAEYLFDDANKFRIYYLKFDPSDTVSDYSPKQDSFLSFHLLEELYKKENDLLDAVKAGDTKRALQSMANLSRHQSPQRSPKKLMDGKSYLLSLNTLLRKTVQNSAVHPMHIHTISHDFARQIEAVESITELNALPDAMIHRYCALVQEYSLGKFSTVVRNVINMVEFNLAEPLTLSTLARQFNIDPSYLSHHFTQEMGMTLTNFINMKRLERAKFLIGGSDIYIQEVAEECGFQDVNYFIRLFKRKYGKTPGEYRHSLYSGVWEGGSLPRVQNKGWTSS